MKTLGLIGGMSWESTLPYYRYVNEAVKARLGGLHSARLLLFSVDFGAVEPLMRAGAWDEIGAQLARAAVTLEGGGAQLLVLCTNTMHTVAPAIEAAVRIPLLHIVDPTAAAIERAQLRQVGLLGTRFTMEREFFKQRLMQRHGLRVLVPPAADREVVHRVIFTELCLGRVNPASRLEMRRVMQSLVADGAQGIILGCTELAMLIGAGDIEVPLFDTTRLHAEAAVASALADPPGN